MPTIADDVNRAYVSLFESAKEHIPTAYLNLAEGACVFNGDETEMYHTPIAGWARHSLRMNDPDNSAGTTAVLRTVVGYSQMWRVVENPQTGILVISNLINQMLLAIYSRFGQRVRSVSFDHLTSPGMYFREIENNAGYDINLYVELTPAIEVLEMETVND